MERNFDWTERLRNLPNKLTLSRLAVLPLMMVSYPFDITPLRFFGAMLFLYAAVTDFFDGYLARKYNNVTPLGALLDPIADKLLLTTALILLVATDRVYAFIPIILISRELFVSGLRLVALERGLRIPVSQGGKWKTALQLIAVFCLMAYDTVPLAWPFKEVGWLSLWVSLGLSLYSAYDYWVVVWAETKNELLT